MRPMSTPTQHIARPGLLVTAFLAAFLALAVGPVSHPAPASASTATTMEAYLVTMINNARANRGVPALRVGSKLVDLAGDRAATMARSAKLQHPSCLACLLRNRAVSFRTCAETIAYTTYPWGYQAAKSIFLSWRNSSTHWGILMSRSYTRFGVGVAYRSSNHSTWAAAVLVG
jgi:uncharacterized protein YkwD